MSKRRAKSNDVEEAAVVERAKSMANDWMRAVSLQHDRIANPRSNDQPFHPFGMDTFHEADVHFLVITLVRLRRVATTLVFVPNQWGAVKSAIEKFDRELPWLKRLRDVFEHLEDYAVDSNLRQSSVSRRELQVWSANVEGIIWLDYNINWNQTLLAATELHASVVTAYKAEATRANELKSG
jgi:hypothetical protein